MNKSFYYEQAQLITENLKKNRENNNPSNYKILLQRLDNISHKISNYCLSELEIYQLRYIYMYNRTLNNILDYETQELEKIIIDTLENNQCVEYNSWYDIYEMITELKYCADKIYKSAKGWRENKESKQ